ncbi:MAG: replication initiation protein, partial [Desulfobacterales bacterium]|nr:replication initiation protein [Desulfobacterales bacterium]
MSKKKSESVLVVKSNSLIEASYRLTLREQRIVLYMASMIQQDDEDFKPIKIEIDDFTKIIGLTGYPKYDEIRETVIQLLKRYLVINTEKTQLHIGWLSSAEYFKGQGYVELCFDPKLKPYLLQLKERFTKYYFQNVIQLSHSYSIRFYELLKQYENIGWRTLQVEELKKILGIYENEYALYANFKLKVLEPVKKELQAKAEQGNLDLSFEYEEIKLSRKVDKIKFIILKSKPNKTNHQEHPEQAQAQSIIPEQAQAQAQDLLESLTSLKVSKPKALEILQQYPSEQIKRNIDYA